MAATLRRVNEAITEQYPDLEIELMKGDGDFYLSSSNDETALKLTALFTTSIPVNNISHLSIDEWLSAVEWVLKDNDRYISERIPLI